MSARPLHSLAAAGLSLCILGAAAWLLLRSPVRVEVAEKPPPPEAAPAPTPLPIDFVLLDQTVPDDNYLPIYPEALDLLDGNPVVIRGFMTPYDSLEDLSTFMVMGFPTGCNFCVPPSVSQVVLARQPARSQRYPYIDGPIEVTGILRLWREDSSDPAHRDEYFLYILQDVEVRSLPPQAFQPPTDHRQ